MPRSHRYGLLYPWRGVELAGLDSMDEDEVDGRLLDLLFELAERRQCPPQDLARLYAVAIGGAMEQARREAGLN